MQYEKMMIEMLERIVALEARVAILEQNNEVEDKTPTKETKLSKKYRYLSVFLQASEDLKIKLPISEIEKIIQTTLPASATEYAEFWANSKSHSIANSWLSVGYKTVEVNLGKGYVVFERIDNIENNPHSSFWAPFNKYAEEDGRLLTVFNKLYNITYESRYELRLSKSNCHIAFVRFIKDNALRVEFYTQDKELFDKIFKDKENIEKELGVTLNWLRLDDKLATRINYKKSFEDNTSLEEKFVWLIESALAFYAVFSKYI